MMNLVGLSSDQPAETEPTGRWFEPGNAEKLQPSNLYEAQITRQRLEQGIEDRPAPR